MCLTAKNAPRRVHSSSLPSQASHSLQHSKPSQDPSLLFSQHTFPPGHPGSLRFGSCYGLVEGCTGSGFFPSANREALQGGVEFPENVWKYKGRVYQWPQTLSSAVLPQGHPYSPGYPQLVIFPPKPHRCWDCSANCQVPLSTECGGQSRAPTL